jgi:hypothetical protein
MTLPEVRILQGAGPEVVSAHTPLLVRRSQIEDAEAQAAIRLERSHNVVPLDDPAYIAEWERKWQENGVKRRKDAVEAALIYPDRYFVWTAMLGEVIVGYADAEALPEMEYTEWKGLTIARNYDGQGIGRALEFERRAWARPIGRPVIARIVDGNVASMRFFGPHHLETGSTEPGFVQVGTEEPTPPERPFRFNVMELGLHALNGDYRRSI